MADTDTLRDRIAKALLARIKWATVPRTQLLNAAPPLLAATEYDLADAVLAVLFGPIPADADVASWTAIRAIQLMNEAGRARDAAPVDRATVLREAADELDSISAQFDIDTCDCGDCTLCVWKDAARHLRQLADGHTKARVVPCAAATLRRPHPAHGWEPQPGMDPARCPGYVEPCPPSCVACAADESHDPAPPAGAGQDGAQTT